MQETLRKMFAPFSDRSVGRYCQVLIRRKWRILVGALLITVPCVWGAGQLRLDTNLMALLPEDSLSLRTLHRVLEHTGGAGDLMVMIESPSLEASLRYARRLAPKIRRLDWVERAAFGPDTSFVEKNALLYMPMDRLRQLDERVAEQLRRERLRHSPLYVDLESDDKAEKAPALGEQLERLMSARDQQRYYVSLDGKILVLVVYPKGITANLGFVRRIHRELTALVDRTEPRRFHRAMKVSVGGTFKNRLDEYDTITRDVRASAVWVTVGLVLLIALYFRHPLAVVVLAIPLLLGIGWGFGAAFLMVGSLNIVTVFLVVILLGLGIDFGIHMLDRFQRERAAGAELSDALSATFQHGARPALVASATTAASFLALALTRFRGFSEFGVIAGVGLLLSSAAFIVVLPALMAIVFERGWMVPRGRRPPRGGGRPLRHPGIVLAVGGVLIVGGVIAAPGAQFEYDLRAIRARAPATREFNRKMREVFRRARDPSVVIAEGPDEARAIKRELQRRKRRLGPKSPIAEVRTVFDLLPRDQDERLQIAARLRPALAQLARARGRHDKRREGELSVDQLLALRRQLDVEPISRPAQLPQQLARPFYGRDRDGTQLVFIFQRYSLMDLRRSREFSDAVGEIRVGGRTYHPASEPLVVAEVLRVVERDAPRGAMLALAALVVLLLLDLRSVTQTLVVLLPLAVGVLWMVACMALVPIKLNILNAAVLPSVLGLGIDGGVHIYHRYRELGPAAMTAVLRQTGGAVAACTGSSMIGFGAMLSADHPGLYSIGLLALFALGACLVAAVGLFPSVLAVGSRLRSRGGMSGDSRQTPSGDPAPGVGGRDG